MNINFTKKEYRALLDMISIAEWVMNAYKTGPVAKNIYSDLEQKIYSYAKEMGFEDLIEYAENLKTYFPTRLFEETSTMMDYIDEYDNETFWDELTERMVERDLLNQMGPEKYDNMTFEESIEKKAFISNKYIDEFNEHGIDNLRIVSK